MGALALSSNACSQAADILSCALATVMAVIEVESNGVGFGPDGRPTIRFESHIFDRRTGGKFRATHPTLSTAALDKSLTAKTQAGEWERFHQAAKLDEAAAIMATSFGLFQIMGFNHKACGYADPFQFMFAMHKDEDEHLRAFANFIRSDERLAQPLRNRNWATFARIYNGPAYAVNQYDERLEKAYRRALKKRQV